jgi:adenosylmethionine-8-amino-7-oxononanoate aminotransferase
VSTPQQPADRHVWHPFTQMQTFFDDDPPAVVTGEGCLLIDDRGRRYLDGVSSLWCNVHGHRVPEIDRAVAEQLGRLAHSTLLGLRSPVAEELARRLAAVTPAGLRWTFFSDSGSSAVEIALKIAFQYWRNRGEPRRTRFVTLGDAYHGDTIGSVSLGGIDLFHRIFSPLLFESLRVASPHCRRCPLRLRRDECDLACAGLVEQALADHPGEVAAVVLEPLVQGAAGIVVHPEGYLARVRAACDRHGVLLVCDEVATGFGRTGKLFACEHEAVSPDILCVAKGLTGGYLPLAATITTAEVFDAFLAGPHEGRHFFHGHTYTGNALACAAALASLDLFAKTNLLDSLPAKIEHLAAGLAPLASHPNVFEIRQRGLMAGVELAADPGRDLPFPPDRRTGHQVILEARRRGVILRPLGDVVVLMPPLAMSLAQIDQLTAVVRESVAAVTGASR